MSTHNRRPDAGGPPSEIAGLPSLWVVLACEDSPRLCTGRHLVRLSLARELGAAGRPPSGLLLLDPHAETPLSNADATTASSRGILVVDCSWNKLGARGEFPPSLARGLRRQVARRLPYLLAANPQHYGRLGELNTAEAVGAAVFLTAGRKVAEELFDRLPGGRGFLRLNEGPLEEYARAATLGELLDVERRYFG